MVCDADRATFTNSDRWPTADGSVGAPVTSVMTVFTVVFTEHSKFGRGARSTHVERAGSSRARQSVAARQATASRRWRQKTLARATNAGGPCGAETCSGGLLDSSTIQRAQELRGAAPCHGRVLRPCAAAVCDATWRCGARQPASLAARHQTPDTSPAVSPAE